MGMMITATTIMQTTVMKITATMGMMTTVTTMVH